MTEITVAAEQVTARLADVRERVDEVDRVLAGLPDAPDAGIATELVAFAMAAAVDAAATAADGYRALIAVAEDVLEDFSGNEERAAEALNDMRTDIEEGP